MNAAKLASKLKAFGVPVVSTDEPNEEVDGLITVSDRISISVPLGGTFLETLEQLDEETFQHGRPSTDLSVIADEVKGLLARHVLEPGHTS